MPCPAFEDRLLDYSDLSAAERYAVDVHTAVCADCREYLETLANIDLELGQWLAANASAPVGVSGSVPRLTALPELLDFVGWSAIAGMLAALAWWWRAPATLPDTVFHYTPYAAAVVAMAAGLWIGVRSWVELRSNE